MVWDSKSEQDERLRFIGEWLKQEHCFSGLCERYGVSRKTGYKWVNRYQYEGIGGLEARSHARHFHPNLTSREVQEAIINLKFRYPSWGPVKLRDWLLRREVLSPAASTIGELLKRHGLVKSRKYRRRVPAHSEPFSACNAPNTVWSADYKGQFLVKDKYCYPLTITDNYSRYLLRCDGLEGPRLDATMKGFERAFMEYGLPERIRTDNGVPFASCGVGGLSRLSIWWLKLGILPERIEPGHPEQNGRHERMHRTLKECTAKPAQKSFRAQQRSFDDFRQVYNHERPHQALEGRCPADVYQTSAREYHQAPKEVLYPEQMQIRRVRCNGDIKCFNKTYYLSGLLTGENIGLEMIDDGKAIIYFARLKLGIVDARSGKIIRP